MMTPEQIEEMKRDPSGYEAKMRREFACKMARAQGLPDPATPEQTEVARQRSAERLHTGTPAAKPDDAFALARKRRMECWGGRQ